MKLSACIEWLFADESDDFAGRIRAARAAGLDAVEFWFWSNKDLDAVEATLKETELSLSGFVAEPMIALTDPANHAEFLAGLAVSMRQAQRLGAKVLIAQAGNDLPGRTRDEQHDALVQCLLAAADVLEGSGVRLGVEPLNTLIDHPGYYLSSTRESLDIVDAVGRPEIGIVYDLYHSYVMGEAIEDVLDGRVSRVIHAHVADHPGRNDPGLGEIDLGKRLSWLYANGYEGAVGLEYRPDGSTGDALAKVRAALSAS
ncbi:TIM barrel protein [Devosia chinhatensis]|uniref:Hydroxypyruvate isomerase n=1 Tax=Devosia chinhatensis TaxID=429727 RepID=A0A0F5FJ79_9HYPH|nr:TIM barrel protein [Devosia chinhatensis]KKB08959.1 hydroxypyruvate isomerase [Devosia chinhatensis]